MVKPFVNAIGTVLLTRLRQHLHPQLWTAAQKVHDEAVVLPVFALGLDTARILYGRDPQQALDLTSAAARLLHVCTSPRVNCNKMDTIIAYVRNFYCDYFHVKAADCRVST